MVTLCHTHTPCTPCTPAVVFGSVKQEVHQQGVAIVNPFSKMIQFSLKTQLLDQINHVPTKEGLTVELDVAVLYHIDPHEARNMYLKLGPEFREVVMKPEIASAVGLFLAPGRPRPPVCC